MANRFTEIIQYFLKIGCLGFGGPLALIAAFQKDLVIKKRWISEEKFARAFALIKALPGPVAAQLAIYLGFIRGGRLGGFIAGLCFIFPAFCLMILFGAFYETFENLKWTQKVLFGMQSASIGVILQSVWQLAKPYRRSFDFGIVALTAAFITFKQPSMEPLVILGLGFLGVGILKLQQELKRRWPMFVVLPVFVFTTTQGLSAIGQLGLVAFKAGAFVFGTGLAIVPLLFHDVVEKHHWLTHRQFMDALALGQITPGPVVITITFIGYKVAGFLGALIATLCVFAPAFINILTWFPLAEKKLGYSVYTQRFMTWALGAVVGSILVVIFKLLLTAPSQTALLISWALSMVTFALALFTKIPVWILIPASGAIALMLF